MSALVGGEGLAGLGRLCERPAGNGIVAAPANPGMERIEARFLGDAFTPHRHDTYALGVTLYGVQTFRYRGEGRHSVPGRVIVLHPDEVHDGGAGTDDGLRYRMLYLEPGLLLDGLGDDHAALPFVRDPVIEDGVLQAALLTALGNLDDQIDDLLVDELIGDIARGLARHGGQAMGAGERRAQRQVGLARDYLAANFARLVRSEELEAVTGLDRYALSRQFRALLGTSPHRFLVMRRLDQARALIQAGEPLAEIAIVTGFADQSHLNRQFKKAFGMTPGKWAGLVGG